MSPPIKLHDMTSPPEAGEAKLRIKSGGSIDTTHVVVVDEHGVERELINVTAVRFTQTLTDLAHVTIGILAPELEVDAAIAPDVAADLIARESAAAKYTSNMRVLLDASPLEVRVTNPEAVS